MLKKRYFAWFLVVCWMVFLFVMSGQNAKESSSTSGKVIEAVASVFNPSFAELSTSEKELFVEQLQVAVRKLAHYLAYCLLGGLTLLAMLTYSMPLRKKLTWSASIGVLYAISDEIHQYFVPGRSMQLSDVIIDSLGVFTGLLIVFGVSYLIDRKVKRASPANNK